MSAERLVARVLMVGGALSVAMMVLGLVALEVHAIATGGTLEVPRVHANRAAGRAVDVFVSLPQVAHALTQWPPDPVAGIAAGVVGLLVTPALGVIVALTGFLAARERDYALICALIVAALVCGFFLRLGH